jgi:hypothetical protein
MPAKPVKTPRRRSHPRSCLDPSDRRCWHDKGFAFTATGDLRDAPSRLKRTRLRASCPEPSQTVTSHVPSGSFGCLRRTQLPSPTGSGVSTRRRRPSRYAAARFEVAEHLPHALLPDVDVDGLLKVHGGRSPRRSLNQALVIRQLIASACSSGRQTDSRTPDIKPTLED